MKQREIHEQKSSLGMLMGAITLEAVSLILYLLMGVTEFTPTLSSMVIGFAVGTVLLGAMVAVLFFTGRANGVADKTLDLILYLVYGAGLLSWLFFLTSEIYYITNILVAIDGTKLSMSFLAMVILFLLAWVLALASAIKYGKQKEDKTKDVRGNQNA